MLDSCVSIFSSKPKSTYHSPLENGDNPGINNANFLDADGIQQCQYLIGTLQREPSLGRIDNTTAHMNMQSFRVEIRIGHVERIKRIYGYLCKHKYRTIRCRTEEPDLPAMPDTHYD